MDINKKELHELFQGIKQGSRTAFEVLYKRYKQLVYKIAFSIIKNKENASKNKGTKSRVYKHFSSFSKPKKTPRNLIKPRFVSKNKL